MEEINLQVKILAPGVVLTQPPQLASAAQVDKVELLVTPPVVKEKVPQLNLWVPVRATEGGEKGTKRGRIYFHAGHELHASGKKIFPCVNDQRNGGHPLKGAFYEALRNGGR